MFFTRAKKQLGYALIVDPSLPMPEEQDSITCYHCNAIEWQQPGQDRVGYCSLCDKYICLKCVGQPCLPFQKRMDQLERRREYTCD